MTPAELITIRHHLSLSRPALAKRLGVHRNTVFNWERGTHRIPRMAELALKSWREETK